MMEPLPPSSLRLALVISIAALTASAAAQTDTRPFQKLHIPEAVTGTNFNLSVHKSSKSFWKGATTATFAYNNETFWGPTLILKKGDTVQMNVRNELDESTTTHWHGLHLPAAMDGGPHQLIEPGGTWISSFTVKNNAATYWYHPHPHEKTQKQMTYGAGGLIIIRDPIESKLALPRTYGVDDIPLVFTSRRFYADDQFSFEGDELVHYWDTKEDFLYDLTTDLSETRNLASDKPEVGARLLKELQAHVRAGFGEQSYAELASGKVTSGGRPGGRPGEKKKRPGGARPPAPTPQQ